MESKTIEGNTITFDLLHGHTDTMTLHLLSEDDRYDYKLRKRLQSDNLVNMNLKK